MLNKKSEDDIQISRFLAKTSIFAAFSAMFYYTSFRGIIQAVKREKPTNQSLDKDGLDRLRKAALLFYSRRIRGRSFPSRISRTPQLAPYPRALPGFISSRPSICSR